MFKISLFIIQISFAAFHTFLLQVFVRVIEKAFGFNERRNTFESSVIFLFFYKLTEATKTYFCHVLTFFFPADPLLLPCFLVH